MALLDIASKQFSVPISILHHLILLCPPSYHHQRRCAVKHTACFLFHCSWLLSQQCFNNLLHFSYTHTYSLSLIFNRPCLNIHHPALRPTQAKISALDHTFTFAINVQRWLDLTIVCWNCKWCLPVQNLSAFIALLFMPWCLPGHREQDAFKDVETVASVCHQARNTQKSMHWSVDTYIKMHSFCKPLQ